MTPTDIEARLRASLQELTSTTPLAHRHHPGPRAVPVHAPSPPQRRSGPQRLVVGAVAAALAIALFALAVAYGPGSADQRGSTTAAARTQSANHLVATVEVRAGDVPGWSGYRTPPPDPTTTEKVARCAGMGHFDGSPPVAGTRSKEFTSDNRTVYAQSYTFVMATVAQAQQMTALVRRSRFPGCDAALARAGISAGLASRSHLSRLAVAVGPPPPGLNESDARTISTSYATHQVGATGEAPVVTRCLLMRGGRVVTALVVSAVLTAGPYPVALFDRLAVTLSRRLARAT